MAVVITLGSLDLGPNSTTHYVNDSATPDFSTPGQIVLPVTVTGATADAMVDSFQAVVRELQKAAVAADDPREAWVSLTWQWDTTNPVYYDVTGGTLVPVRLYPVTHTIEATLTLTCLPHARGASQTITVAGTLTNGSAQFLVDNVLGDLDALCHIEITDTSAAGVVNRIRAGRRSASSISALGEFDPWVDVAALSGAIDTADATAFGGSYAVRGPITSATFVDLARATTPAGALNRGAFNLWGRVFDTATAMAAPTSFAATVTEPTTATTSTTNTVEVVQTNATRTTAGTTIAPSWGSATVAGNWLLAGVIQQANDTAITAPGGWTLRGTYQITSEVGNEITLHLYEIKAAASRSGAETWSGLATAAAANPNVAFLMELSGVYAGTYNAWIGATSGSSATDAASITQAGPSAAFAGQAYIAVMATAGADTTTQLSYWGGGFQEVYDANELLIGLRRAANVGDAVSAVANLSANFLAYVAVVIGLRPATTSTTTTTSAPGSLPAGTYTPRVQAVDPVGTLSDARALTGTTFTVVTAGASVALSWVAPSGSVSHYRITYQLDGRVYWFDTPDNSVSYTLTSRDGHVLTDALPATSGATAPPARLRALVGTSGDAGADLLPLPEVVLTGAGAWRDVLLGSARDLPPVGAHINGDTPSWAVETEIRSANGLNVTVRLDALWLVPAWEPQLTLEFAGLALATKRRWVAETDRRGRATVAWLEDTGTGAEAGHIAADGYLTLAPGDNIVALQLEQAAGLADLAATVTVTMYVYPRYRWGRGAT